MSKDACIFGNRSSGKTTLGQDIFNVVICGDRASGKTTLVRDLLYKLDLPSFILNGVQTDDYNDVPNVCYSELYTSQQQITSIFKQMSKDSRTPKIIVLENLDSKIREFYDLFMNSWAYKVIVITTLQTMYSLPPHFRSQIDCIYILHTSFHEQKSLYEMFVGDSYFKTFSEFYSVVKKHTKNYGCVVINDSTWIPFKASMHRRREWMINKN